MPATLTAGDEMLREIIAHPERDDVRLIYADWLEEEGGQPERAAFIRNAILVPTSMLDAAYDGEYFDMTVGIDADLWGRIDGDDFGLWLTVTATADAGEVVYGVHRGMVDCVRLPLAAWRQHGPSLVRSHPITRVELSDREPRAGVAGWGWWRESSAVGYPTDLSGDVWDILKGSEVVEGRHKWYSSRSAAIDALSDALLQATNDSLMVSELVEGMSKKSSVSNMP